MKQRPKSVARDEGIWNNLRDLRPFPKPIGMGAPSQGRACQSSYSRRYSADRAGTGAAINYIVTRKPYDEHPPRFEYVLTEKSRTLGSVMKALRDWGTQHARSATPAVGRDTAPAGRKRRQGWWRGCGAGNPFWCARSRAGVRPDH